MRLPSLFIAIALWLPEAVLAATGFGDYATVEFAPARGQTFKIPVELERSGRVEIHILSPDGERVRILRAEQPLAPGRHALVWDGRDDNDVVVPDEAYIPILRVSPARGETLIIDPRATSGGEMLDGLRAEVTTSQDLAYSLPAPARILIRVGIKAGPMLRSLATWEPRGPGKNVQRWDGHDADGLRDIRSHERLGILVMGFKLPAHAIITIGNQSLDYGEYRQRQGWSESITNPKDRLLIRDGTRIAREYYTPRAQLRDPQVTLTLATELETSARGLPVVNAGQTVPLKVDIPKEDRWTVNESQYEVAFFLDGEFIAEEERGYVPLTWNWRPRNITPGEHLMTVNISGFSGKVGVASVLIDVAK